MDVYTVSLFGHREVDDLILLEKRLSPIIKDLLLSQPFVSFLIGRNGEFDEFSASVIKRVRKGSSFENNSISLILPYLVSGMDDYENYYDDIIIPEEVEGAHPKSAIGLRNRWMVGKSDLVIVYVNRKSGGAYNALKYARLLNKKVINLCEL